MFNWHLARFFRHPRPIVPIPCAMNPLHPGQLIAVEPGADRAGVACREDKHTVPAVGFWLDSGEGSLVFTGDTTVQNAFWDQVNQMIGNPRHLLIETVLASWERPLAERSKTPVARHARASELAKLIDRHHSRYPPQAR